MRDLYTMRVVSKDMLARVDYTFQYTIRSRVGFVDYARFVKAEHQSALNSSIVKVMLKTNQCDEQSISILVGTMLHVLSPLGIETLRDMARFFHTPIEGKEYASEVTAAVLVRYGIPPCVERLLSASFWGPIDSDSRAGADDSDSDDSENAQYLLKKGSGNVLRFMSTIKSFSIGFRSLANMCKAKTIPKGILVKYMSHQFDQPYSDDQMPHMVECVRSILSVHSMKKRWLLTVFVDALFVSRMYDNLLGYPSFSAVIDQIDNVIWLAHATGSQTVLSLVYQHVTLSNPTAWISLPYTEFTPIGLNTTSGMVSMLCHPMTAKNARHDDAINVAMTILLAPTDAVRVALVHEPDCIYHKKLAKSELATSMLSTMEAAANSNILVVARNFIRTCNEPELHIVHAKRPTHTNAVTEARLTDMFFEAILDRG